jgi:hypothetical protein
MDDIAIGLQLAFVVFFGPVLAWLMALVVVGTIAEVFIGIFRDDVQRVKIVGREDE